MWPVRQQSLFLRCPSCAPHAYRGCEYARRPLPLHAGRATRARRRTPPGLGSWRSDGRGVCAAATAGLPQETARREMSRFGAGVRHMYVPLYTHYAQSTEYRPHRPHTPKPCRTDGLPPASPRPTMTGGMCYCRCCSYVHAYYIPSADLILSPVREGRLGCRRPPGTRFSPGPPWIGLHGLLHTAGELRRWPFLPFHM